MACYGDSFAFFFTISSFILSPTVSKRHVYVYCGAGAGVLSHASVMSSCSPNFTGTINKIANYLLFLLNIYV
jgi:hypothetical protein